MFQDFLSAFQGFAQTFTRSGKKVYLVGGAVRNRLLGYPAGDFDFTTNATPQEVIKLFPRVLPTGIQHGTVTVLYQSQPLEVTTFRVDGKYSNARHPDQVSYTGSLEEDLLRRDFTINALALDLDSGELIDITGGRFDLEQKVLRAIGQAETRFREDALRMLRLFRFSSQLGFTIEPQTLAAVRLCREDLGKLSRERVRDEVVKTLLAPFPARGWGAWQKENLLPWIFPSLQKAEFSSAVLGQVEVLPPHLRLAFLRSVFLLDEGRLRAPFLDWDAELRALCFSNQDRATQVKMLTLIAEATHEADTEVTVKKALFHWGNRILPANFDQVWQALAQVFPHKADQWQAWGQALNRIVASDDPLFLKDLAISGNELIELGLSPGPTIGKVLSQLLTAVWENPSLNKNQTLRQLCQTL
ncbi:MAG: hypothetical protein HKM05_10990 [Spirochaetales bacterium]|nr:hypothetical protein [Spirochaetales bacterium]